MAQTSMDHLLVSQGHFSHETEKKFFKRQNWMKMEKKKLFFKKKIIFIAAFYFGILICVK